LERGTPVPMPHPLGAASIHAPLALRSSCPKWKPGAPRRFRAGYGPGPSNEQQTVPERGVVTSRGPFLPRDAMLAQYMQSSCVSVSFCLSVCMWYCIKTAKHAMTQIIPHDSPGTLVV